MDFILLVHPRNTPDNDNVPLGQWDCVAKFSAVTVDAARQTAMTSMKAYLLDHPRTISLLTQLHSRFGLLGMTLQQDDF